MRSNLGQHGTNTLSSDITNITAVGFWILIDGVEYFVPFEDYPVFRRATLNQIFNFSQISGQLHWPDLDADIEIKALENPVDYPLVWKD